MKTKQKKCKGTGKAIGYGCGELKVNRKYGLGIDCCYASWLYSNDGYETLSKSIIRSKKKVEKEQKEKTRKQKIDNKSIALLMFEAKQPFQKLIRIRDHGQNCISCGKKLSFDIGQYHAGHLFKAEIYTGLVLHPDNVHGQCIKCNTYLNGNESGYLENLTTRIGADRYKNILELKNTCKNHKWDRFKLIELKKHYANELKLVESGAKNIEDIDFEIGIIK